MLLIKPSSSPIVHHKDVGSVSQITGKDRNFNALKIVLVLYEEIFEQLKHFPSAGCEEERAGSKSVMFQLWSDRAGQARRPLRTPPHTSVKLSGERLLRVQLHYRTYLSQSHHLEWFALKSIS